jgi:hypothetical protein
VGIGTSSPASKLVVESNVSTPLWVTNTTNAVANTSVGIDFRMHNSADSLMVAGSVRALAEGTWGTTSTTRDSSIVIRPVLNGSEFEGMRVDSSGNVGISENDPSSKLSIGGNSDATTIKPTLNISDLTNGGSVNIRGLSPVLAFDKTGANATPTILMDGGGLQWKTGTLDNYGSRVLQIHTTGTLECTSSDANAQIKITPLGTNANGTINFNTPGTGSAVIQVQGTERLRINDAGIDLSGGYITTEQGRTNHVANTVSSPYYRFNTLAEQILLGSSDEVALVAPHFAIEVMCIAPSVANGGTNYYLYDNEIYQASGVTYRIDGSGRRPYFRMSQAGDASSLYSTKVLDDGKWHHLVFTYDGTYGSWYVDGVFDVKAAMTHHLPPTQPTTISRNSQSFDDGSISKFKIYNTALTDDDIKELYSGASVPYKYMGASQTNHLTLQTYGAATKGGGGVYNFVANGQNGWEGGSAIFEDNMWPDDSTHFKKVRLKYTVDSTTLVGNPNLYTGSWSSTEIMIGTTLSGAVGTHTYEVTINDVNDGGKVGSNDKLYIYTLSNNTSGEITLSDVSVTLIGVVAEYDGSSATNSIWYDKSGNGLNGEIVGNVTLENKVAALQVENLNVNLSEYSNTSITGNLSADIFIYDTSKDSDGGAWRKRTQHTSWYNEAASSTRGSRKEFPAVAVIIASGNKITIYDGDTPDLDMWMVFTGTILNRNYGWMAYDAKPQKIAAVNGIIALGCLGNNVDSGGVQTIELVKDILTRRWSSVGGSMGFLPEIIQRNSSTNIIRDNSLGAIKHKRCNTVAMTVLPNAPIDSASGLPTPTIIAGCETGLSIIHDDGTVTNRDANWYTDGGGVSDITMDTKNSFWYSNGYYGEGTPNPNHGGMMGHTNVSDTGNLASGNTTSSELVMAIGSNDNGYSTHWTASKMPGVWMNMDGDNTRANIGLTHIAPDGTLGSQYGVSRLLYNPDHSKSSVAYITSKYNTGYMTGYAMGAWNVDSTEFPELINNGTFDVDTAGWAGDSGGTISAAGGIATVDYGGAGNDNTYAIKQFNAVTSGKEYSISFRFRPHNTGTFRIRAGGSAISWYTTSFTVGGWNDVSVVVRADGSTLEIGSNGGAMTSFDIDDISVKEVSLGSEYHPTSNYAIHTDGGHTKDLVQPVLGLTGATGTGLSRIYIQCPDIISGKTYSFTVDTTFVTGSCEVKIGVGANNSAHMFLHGSSNPPLIPGRHTYVFTATSSNLWITLEAGSSVNATWNNISVKEGIPDRSVKGVGLGVVGSPIISSVAPGADLKCISGLVSNPGYTVNGTRLQQHRNSDLDFTGDWNISGWIKGDPTGDFTIAWTDSSGDNGWMMYHNASTSYFIDANWDAYSAYLQSNDTSTLKGVGTPKWRKFNYVKVGGKLHYYIDGVPSTNGFEKDISSWTLTNTSSHQLYAYSNTLGHKLSLFNISATAPTTEQIKEIYEAEKPLFYANAKCTLTGEGGAVIAMDYDDSNDELLVGTGSGLSVFKGLVRVDENTNNITSAAQQGGLRVEEY